MTRDETLFLDMLSAANDAVEFVRGLSWPEFASSKLHQAAVIHSIMIVGEAASKVSDVARAANPDLHWKEMVGMRNRLVHGYGEVRLDLVWSVAQTRLPELIEALQPLIPKNDG